METCRDCLHYEVCQYHIAEETDMTINECSHGFKNKADFVEVKCRCADCKHYRRYGKTSLLFEGKNVQAGWCVLRAKFDEEHRMLPFDFCSYGERKDSE